MLYTLGRVWIENLRVDDVQLVDVGGLRFNVWTSIVLFVLAAAYFAWATVQAPGTRGDGLHPRAGPSRTRPRPVADRRPERLRA